MPSTLFDLTGRAALVTGAGSGIGRRLAVGLAEHGADVSCLDLDRQRDGVAATVAEIEGLGRRGVPLAADVTDPASVDEAVGQHVAAFGGIDVAVNCAGIVGSVAAEEMDPADWRRVLAVNLDGLFFSCQAQARRMLAAGHGSIVNIASMSATIANRGQLQSHYNASKAGVKHLTASLALEWAGRGVRVNAISPGYIRTPLIDKPEWADRIARWADETPAGRIGTPDDVVGPVVFLASAASDYVTGADLLVDGGFTKW